MSKFKVNERDILPAKVKREDGWREMSIKLLLCEQTVGCRSAVLYKAAHKFGAAHEKHIHHRADELVYVISGKGHRWQADEEWDVEPGDAYFIPRGTVHAALGTDPEDPLVVVGVYVGAGSLEETGYEFIDHVRWTPPTP